MSIAVYQDLGYLAASLGQAPATRPLLKLGSTNAAVSELQTLLSQFYTQSFGWQPGVFDQATFDVVKKFQADKGLKVDGVVGKDTWPALLGYSVQVGGSAGGASTGSGTPTGTDSSLPQYAPSADDKLLGLPKKYVYVGGAVLALGLVYVLLAPPRRTYA